MGFLTSAYKKVKEAIVAISIRSQLQNDFDPLSPRLQGMYPSEIKQTSLRDVKGYSRFKMYVEGGVLMNMDYVGILFNLLEITEKNKREFLLNPKPIEFCTSSTISTNSAPLTPSFGDATPKLQELCSPVDYTSARMDVTLDELTFVTLMGKALPNSQDRKDLGRLYQESQSTGGVLNQEQINVLGDLITRLDMQPEDLIMAAYRWDLSRENKASDLGLN